MMIHVRVNDQPGEGVLAGAGSGRRAFSRVVQQLPDRCGDVLVLDFEGVDVATASYLTQLVIPLRNYCRDRLGLPVLAANMNDAVAEELAAVLSAQSDALVTCVLSAQHHVQSPRVLGVLEEKQLLALRTLAEFGEADAPTLAASVAETVGPTAWNNRLGALEQKGLVRARQEGRVKKYRLLMEDLRYGP